MEWIGCLFGQSVCKPHETFGYHFEHNYGHGKQHLSSLLATLIILAYLLHTLLEWMDDKYCLLRQKIPSRQRLFNDMRALTTYLCFESWDALIDLAASVKLRRDVLLQPVQTQEMMEISTLHKELNNFPGCLRSPSAQSYAGGH